MGQELLSVRREFEGKAVLLTGATQNGGKQTAKRLATNSRVTALGTVGELVRNLTLLACPDITGGTGFVGSVVLEQLLRLVPTVGRIYVLVREKRGVKGE